MAVMGSSSCECLVLGSLRDRKLCRLQDKDGYPGRTPWSNQRQINGGQQRYTFINAFFCSVSREMGLFNCSRHPRGDMGFKRDDSETPACRLPGLNGDVIWV